MKKAILKSIGNLEIVECPIHSIGAKEILIKVKACGICGADIKSYKHGHRDLTFPRVLGHEIAGVIFDKGSQVSNDYAIGNRVQISPGVFCNSCDYCISNRDNLCDQMEIMGFDRDGGMQEYLLMDEKSIASSIINPLPEGLSFALGTYAEPLACAMNMQDKMNLTVIDTLLIIGAGRLGTLHYLLAKEKKIPNVIVADINAQRLGNELFDNTINVTDKNLNSELNAITKNQGACATVICCSVPEVLSLAITNTKKSGIIGYFSGFTEGRISLKELNLIHYKEIIIVGSYGCKESDNLKALQFINEKQNLFEKINRVLLPIDEIDKGMDLLTNYKTLSVIIKMED